LPVVGDNPGLMEEAAAVDIEPDTELLTVVQDLTPQYRIVFNLHVMEGYKHLEIAQLLDISEGTSRSNLLRAKAKIKEQILALQQTKKSSFKYGRFLQTN
jgi:RNA polymerase sigma-70 factor (ECF subfamily)